ncbi:MAG: hypothetical protein U9Q21_00290 [Candidatus Auribacterota bacterium]|nr:hypothetical protein [Candidatus Auribacterota bacterium]
MQVELLSITPDAEKWIELAGRTCHNSIHKIKEGGFIMELEKDISKIVRETVKKYQKIWGEKNLYFWDTWKDDIIEEVVCYIKKRDDSNGC